MKLLTIRSLTLGFLSSEVPTPNICLMWQPFGAFIQGFILISKILNFPFLEYIVSFIEESEGFLLGAREFNVCLLSLLYCSQAVNNTILFR